MNACQLLYAAAGKPPGATWEEARRAGRRRDPLAFNALTEKFPELRGYT